MHRRRHHLVHLQRVHQPANRRDVRDGVRRANFVKVNFTDAPAVRPRLRRRQVLVNLCDMRLDHIGKIEVVDGMKDFRQRAVFVVVMVTLRVFMVVMGTLRVFMPAMEMRMFVFLVSMHLDGKMRRRNAALHRPLAREFNTWNAESIQCPHNRCRVGHQFQQGAREHVARRTHRTIKIKRLHFPSYLPTFSPFHLAMSHNSSIAGSSVSSCRNCRRNSRWLRSAVRRRVVA